MSTETEDLKRRVRLAESDADKLRNSRRVLQQEVDRLTILLRTANDTDLGRLLETYRRGAKLPDHIDPDDTEAVLAYLSDVYRGDGPSPWWVPVIRRLAQGAGE